MFFFLVPADDDIQRLNGADNIKLRVKEKLQSRQSQGRVVADILHVFIQVYMHSLVNSLFITY